MGKAESDWAELMRAARAGDAKAYRRFLAGLAPLLRAFARRSFARVAIAEADAEDVVQETLLAIHLKRHTWNAAQPIGPWIWAIARHKLIDAMRRRGRRMELPIEDWSELLPVEEGEPALAFQIERQLKRLPTRQQEVLRAIAVEGASISDTAAKLTMTEGAVRVALHRALAALAKLAKDAK